MTLLELINHLEQFDETMEVKFYHASTPGRWTDAKLEDFQEYNGNLDIVI